MTDDTRIGDDKRWYRDAFRESNGAPCRVLLLGEDNPQSSDDQYALYNYPPNCAGHRLQKIFGLDDETYLALWRANLCNPRWNAKKARERAVELYRRDNPWTLIICLGRKVTDVMFARSTTALVAPDFGMFETRHALCSADVRGVAPTPSMRFLSLPHPSGRNQVWNNPAARTQARLLLREAAPEIAWGEP